MKLSDFFLWPVETTAVDDDIDLVAHEDDFVADPQVRRYVRMLVTADTENEVRMVLRLIWDEFRDGNLAVDEKLLAAEFSF